MSTKSVILAINFYKKKKKFKFKIQKAPTWVSFKITLYYKKIVIISTDSPRYKNPYQKQWEIRI